MDLCRTALFSYWLFFCFEFQNPDFCVSRLFLYASTVTFLFLSQNLSPVLTRMTKNVDAREKELTHQVHRDMLLRSLEQVKNLTPVLISGIKIFITAKQSGES